MQEDDFFVYVHVDGEFYKMKNPKMINIALAKENIPDGKLRILCRNKKPYRS